MEYVNDEILNSLIEKSIVVADELENKYNYPSNITHLLYLIIPAFIIKYSNEFTILDSFRNIPIMISGNNDKIYQAYYFSKLVYDNGEYKTNKGIVLNNYENIDLMQLLDNLVHEFNHAINSINQQILQRDNKIYVRTGLTSIIYNKDLSVSGKLDNSILEEVINTKQTESLINIINSFNKYNINNSIVSATLYSIGNIISNKYSSDAYYVQSYICKSLMENKTFISTLEKLRFNGDISDIETWFDMITGEEKSYNRLIDLLKRTFDLEIELTKTKWFKKNKINKIKELNNEAIHIINKFNNNCNYK